MTYILTHEIEKWTQMHRKEFVEIGLTDDKRMFPCVHVIEVPKRGYAILGPSGAYVYGEGERIIKSLDEVYQTLNSLGIKLVTVKGMVERLDEYNT